MRTMWDGWYTLDENGEPVPIADERTRRPTVEESTVARTTLREEADGGEVVVSTVFLGLDHRHGEGEPILWETLVFGGPLDDEMERYESRAEANAGQAGSRARVIEEEER